ncbi:MAG: DUF2254 family protein [Thermonemataceae bacterium]|nr:DUF2254 family protein [Thermonemataceae bacterium]
MSNKNLKNKELLKDYLEIFKSNTFKVIYLILGFTILLTFTTKADFLIKTDKAGYIDALNLLASLLATIVATVYSITIVALQLASTQFSPRILRYFLSHSLYNQITLGAFLGWVLYCLLLKFWLIDAIPPEQSFIPNSMKPILNLAIYGGIGLIGIVLPHFIISIAESINAASITRKIALNTFDTIYQMKDSWKKQEEVKILPEQAKNRILAQEMGYLRAIKTKKLKKLTEIYPEIAFIEQANDIGSFIHKNIEIAYIAYNVPSKRQTEIEQQIYQQFSIGKFRNPQQDIHFGLRQLVDIALKAISPAINDPTTAVNCLDYLAEIISVAMEANIPATRFTKIQDTPIYLREVCLEKVVNQAFDQIYHYGKSDFAVMIRLTDVLQKNIQLARRTEYVDIFRYELSEIALDFLYQYQLGNLKHLHSQEQLLRIFGNIVEGLDSIKIQYKHLEDDSYTNEASFLSLEKKYKEQIELLQAAKQTLI